MLLKLTAPHFVGIGQEFIVEPNKDGLGRIRLSIVDHGEVLSFFELSKYELEMALDFVNFQENQGKH